MKSPTLNGWLSWSFDDVPYSIRTSKAQTYKFHINKDSSSVGTYQEELYNNACAMRDYYTGKFDMLLSGGIDSEVVVRVFKDLGINHNTFIIRYENDINKRDVNSAIEIANSLNIKYSIIDMNLQNFYENEAYELYKRSGCIRAARLPHLKFMEFVDNIPVMGDAEPYWKLDPETLEWKFPFGEGNHNASMYCYTTGRENICDWYEFTPNLIKAFNRHPVIQQLLSNQLPGKTSSWTSRIPIHKIYWPDIKQKLKLTGYESDNDPGVYPEYITRMQELITSEIGEGNDYWFTQSELENLL